MVTKVWTLHCEGRHGQDLSVYATRERALQAGCAVIEELFTSLWCADDDPIMEVAEHLDAGRLHEAFVLWNQLACEQERDHLTIEEHEVVS